MPASLRQVGAQPLWLALALTVFVLHSRWLVEAASCSTDDGVSRAVLQLQNMYSSCPPGDRNGIVAECGVAFRALTSTSGRVTLIPLVMGTHRWRGPDPATSGTFNCKDLNATGQLTGRSKTQASVTLYNDLGGPLTHLAATRTGMVSLTPAHTYSWQPPAPNCTYVYKVVQGCFLGIPAPPKRPPCSPGTYVARGRGRFKYCAPCPAGRTSRAPDATACSRCPKGTYKAAAGGRCLECAPGTYASEPGATACASCTGANSYTDGVVCKACPRGSFVALNRSQCQVCNGRHRCCTVGSAPDCPPCKKGFKSGRTATSSFALVAATPPECGALEPAVCTSTFTVTLAPACTLTWAPATSQDVIRTFCYSGSTVTQWSGRTLSPARDFSAFTAYTDSQTITANLTSAAAPFLTFTFPQLGNCSYTYRALTTPAAALLGAAPQPCLPGRPGCAALPAPPALPLCPAGTYPLATVNSTSVCVPCPPGYFSATEASTCTPCPAGFYASGYGNVACQTCGPGTSAPTGSNACQPCLAGSFAPDGAAECSVCPTGSSKPGWSYCLGNHLGSICCAGGVCRGGPPCPSSVTDPPTNHAILRLESTSLDAPSCKAAEFLRCLQPGAQLGATFEGGIGLRLQPISQPRCLSRTQPPEVFQLQGEYNDVNNATLESAYTPHAHNYTLRSWRVNNTLDLLLSDAPECTVTLTLTYGFLMDLAPPSQSACPAATLPSSIEGRVFCSVCDQGQALTNGACTDCPGGSAQPLYGAGTCRRCAPGTAGSGAACTRCPPGSYAHRGWPACRPCPRNTYSRAAAEDCARCPKGTTAPPGASACSTPFRVL